MKPRGSVDVDEVLVGAHALHVGGGRAVGGDVDRDHAGQAGDVEAGRVAPGDRARNRFEVRLASRTGAPAGIASYDARNRATASACVSHPTTSLTGTT